jgi:putative ABC transport system substrate-binding protein
MRRRELLLLVGGTLIPLRALRAQQKAMPVIGYLGSGLPGAFAPLAAAFQQGLSETGYVEGQNVAIEYRWAEDPYHRLPALAARSRRPQGRFDRGKRRPPFRARCEKRDLDDPDRLPRHQRPGRGRAGRQSRPAGRQRHGLQPFPVRTDAQAARAAYRAGSAGQGDRPAGEPERPESRGPHQRHAGSGAHQGGTILKAGTESEIDAAFTTLVELQAGALLVFPDPLFLSRREQFVALASRHAVPALYPWRELAAAGGLISYGTSATAGYRLAGMYAGKLLKGANPTDLPVQRPTTFELVVNLNTAKTLGLTIPHSILMLADEVIE